MMQKHWRHLFRFALTGIGATALHTAIALGLIGLTQMPPPAANGAAFCVATVFSYVCNTLWSFSRPIRGRTMGRFLIISVAGFFLAMGLAWVAQALDWTPLAGIALVICFVPGLSFVLHKMWTYQ